MSTTAELGRSVTLDPMAAATGIPGPGRVERALIRKLDRAEAARLPDPLRIAEVIR